MATTVLPTEGPGDATRLAAAAAADGCCLVFAAGGDGTLREVAAGLTHTETILAPLPAGTANSFAKELGLPRPGLLSGPPLERLDELLRQGTVQRMDVGWNGKDIWLLWAGIGLDSYVVDRVEPRPRWSKNLGQAGYILQSLPWIPLFEGVPMTVDVDGTPINDTFMLVIISNCRRYGAEVTLNPEATLDDGVFEVWLFRGDRLQDAVRYGTALLAGRHKEEPGVTILRARHVSVRSERPWPVHMDGDKAGDTPFWCTVRPGALRVLVPDIRARRPFSPSGEPLDCS